MNVIFFHFIHFPLSLSLSLSSALYCVVFVLLLLLLLSLRALCLFPLLLLLPLLLHFVTFDFHCTRLLSLAAIACRPKRDFCENLPYKMRVWNFHSALLLFASYTGMALKQCVRCDKWQSLFKLKSKRASEHNSKINCKWIIIWGESERERTHERVRCGEGIDREYNQVART